MKAVLFDFNGTLFDDVRFNIEAWSDYVMDKFGERLEEAELRRRFVGPCNDKIFTDMYGKNITKAEIVREELDKESRYRDAARKNPANMHLMEGAPELFDLLVERGIPFAVATASPIENVNFYLDELGLKKWVTLDRIVYEEGKLRSKPEPDFYIEAARRIGMTPEECLIVEDSPTGIQAAINAKAGRIVAIDRSAPMEWLKSKPEIDALIHDFHGFERFLEDFE